MPTPNLCAFCNKPATQFFERDTQAAGTVKTEYKPTVSKRIMAFRAYHECAWICDQCMRSRPRKQCRTGLILLIVAVGFGSLLVYINDSGFSEDHAGIFLLIMAVCGFSFIGGMVNLIMGLAALGSKAQNVENLFLSIGLKRIRDRRCEVCGGEGIVTSIHTGGEFEEDANAYRCAEHPPGRLPAPFFARPVAETATKNASSPAAV